MLKGSAPSPLSIDAVLDHVAIAVEDLPAATEWWLDLGATPVSGMSGDAFSTEQIRLSNGGKIELISTGTTDSTFIGAYLERFGSGRIHHITLKTNNSIGHAVRQLASAGLQAVDISHANPDWHEAFLRPSQVGGIIVQVAWSPNSDTEFAIMQGRGIPPDTNPDAPALRQVVLGHTDPDEARHVWSTLGATLSDSDNGGFVASFAGSPVDVAVLPRDTSGPLGLRSADWDPATACAYAPELLNLPGPAV